MADLVAEVRRRFATRSRAEWVERLERSECIWGLNQSPIDIPEDPQVRANGYIMEIPRPGGAAFRAVAAPVQFDGRSAAARHPARPLGADTDAVLREAGVSDAEIAAARAAGAIA
jgi:crotonobetainyl-CoA:carnitine CoA-transferase CaiB-like acyl-CoA transferase